MLTLSLFLSLYLSISPSQLLKAVRPCGFLCMLTSKWTSRHNGVHNFVFLIWAAGSAPAAVASLLVDPPEPQGIGKHYLLAPLHLLSSDSFSSLICSLLLFSSLCLFPSLLFICPYCRKFDFETSFDNAKYIHEESYTQTNSRPDNYTESCGQP